MPSSLKQSARSAANAWVWLPTFGFLYYEFLEHRGQAIGWVVRRSTKVYYTAIYSDGTHHRSQTTKGPLGYSFAHARQFVTNLAKEYGKS